MLVYLKLYVASVRLELTHCLRGSVNTLKVVEKTLIRKSVQLSLVESDLSVNHHRPYWCVRSITYHLCSGGDTSFETDHNARYVSQLSTLSTNTRALIIQHNEA